MFKDINFHLTFYRTYMQKTIHAINVHLTNFHELDT